MMRNLVAQIELESRRNEEQLAREQLLGPKLFLDEDTIPWIFNHIDCFVSQSRRNKGVEEIYFCTDESFDGHGDDYAWEKVGRAVAKLKSLKSLYISTRDIMYADHDDDEGLPSPDWEILARILSHVRQNVSVRLDEECDLWAVGEAQALARAIHGHPTITSFDSCIYLSYESMDSLFSALATLPALESIVLSNSGPHARLKDESPMAHHESLTELLRILSLRSVCFDGFDFTPALCQAAATAFMKGTAVTKLELYNCCFPAEENTAIMTKLLTINTSVISLTVQVDNSRALFDALALSLPSNSTLRNLEFSCLRDNDDLDCLLPVFSALGQNAGHKSLILYLDEFDSIDESWCTAIQNGLATNATLERLEFKQIYLCDDTTADLLCKAFSFLRTNT
jgi:hypothetical protein